METVAIKVLSGQMDATVMESFQREVKIMRLLQIFALLINTQHKYSKVVHANVCLLFGACITGPQKAIVMQYLPKGDLEHLIKSKVYNQTYDFRLLMPPSEDLSLLVRIRMACDAARGMVWLHQSNPIIFHRLLLSKIFIVSNNLQRP